MARIDELFTKFHEIASNPRKMLEQYLKKGKKVIGCAPVYTPEELIYSLGMIPMGLWGANVEISDAKQYFPAFICSIMQSVLELGLNGAYKGISAVMIPSLCDSMKGLCENWKYAVPDIEFIPADYPQNRKIDAGFQYVKSTYMKHIDRMERISGRQFDIADLEYANEIYNTHNAAMRKLSDVLAKHPSVLPSQRSDIFKSALFMDKKDHTALVLELIELLESIQDTEVRIRIVTTGIQTDYPELLRIFEENHIQIVADDVAQESRQYLTDTPYRKNPVEAAAQKFCDRDNCSLLYDIEKKRLNKLLQTVKDQDADGVIYVQTKFCDPEEFDYVPMKELLEKHDIPVLMIEVDRQMTVFEQVRTAVQTFCEMLEGER